MTILQGESHSSVVSFDQGFFVIHDVARLLVNRSSGQSTPEQFLILAIILAVSVARSNQHIPVCMVSSF